MAEAIGRSAKTLEALYAHPIPANLHWTDVLTLIRRFGSVEHQRHGHLHVDVGGHGLTLKHTNAKQVDKDQVIQLRDFLKGLGITPGHPSAGALGLDTLAEPGLIVVLGDHDAKLWHRPAAHAQPEDGHLLYPHDPHHLRGPVHLAKETAFEGQPAPEDYEFYKALVKALSPAPKNPCDRRCGPQRQRHAAFPSIPHKTSQGAAPARRSLRRCRCCGAERSKNRRDCRALLALKHARRVHTREKGWRLPWRNPRFRRR